MAVNLLLCIVSPVTLFKIYTHKLQSNQQSLNVSSFDLHFTTRSDKHANLQQLNVGSFPSHASPETGGATRVSGAASR